MLACTLKVSEFEPVMRVTDDRGYSQKESKGQTDPRKRQLGSRPKDLPAADQEWNRDQWGNRDEVLGSPRILPVPVPGELCVNQQPCDPDHPDVQRLGPIASKKCRKTKQRQEQRRRVNEDPLSRTDQQAR